MKSINEHTGEDYTTEKSKRLASLATSVNRPNSATLDSSNADDPSSGNSTTPSSQSTPMFRRMVFSSVEEKSSTSGNRSKGFRDHEKYAGVIDEHAFLESTKQSTPIDVAVMLNPPQFGLVNPRLRLVHDGGNEVDFLVAKNSGTSLIDPETLKGSPDTWARSNTSAVGFSFIWMQSGGIPAQFNGGSPSMNPDLHTGDIVMERGTDYSDAGISASGLSKLESILGWRGCIASWKSRADSIRGTIATVIGVRMSGTAIGLETIEFETFAPSIGGYSTETEGGKLMFRTRWLIAGALLDESFIAFSRTDSMPNGAYCPNGLVAGVTSPRVNEAIIRLNSNVELESPTIALLNKPVNGVNELCL